MPTESDEVHAYYVKRVKGAAFLAVRVTIQGDRVVDTEVSRENLQGIVTSEIEDALLEQARKHEPVDPKEFKPH